jgi:hypothetical protein
MPMAGMIVRIIPPRLLDFSALHIGESTTLVLRRDVDVSEWISASMMVRVNEVDMAGGAVEIKAQYQSPAEDDPGLDFATDVATSTVIDTGTIVPSFLTVGLGRSLGSGLRIVAMGTRTSSGNIAVVAAVDLKLADHMYAGS